MPIAYLKHYITKEDAEKIAKNVGISLRSVQSVLSGKVKKSIAIPYLIEAAIIRKENINKKVKTILINP